MMKRMTMMPTTGGPIQSTEAGNERGGMMPRIRQARPVKLGYVNGHGTEYVFTIDELEFIRFCDEVLHDNDYEGVIESWDPSGNGHELAMFANRRKGESHVPYAGIRCSLVPGRHHNMAGKPCGKPHGKA